MLETKPIRLASAGVGIAMISPALAVADAGVDHANEGVSQGGINLLTVLHPMVVHFPIALLMTALFFELIRTISKKDSVKTCAEWMTYLAAASAIVAVGAGYLAAESLGHDSSGHDLVHDHRNIMIGMTTGLVLTALLLAWSDRFRNGSLRGGLVVVLVLLAGVMAFGADKGGRLVYEFGTGVNPALFKVQETTPHRQWEQSNQQDKGPEQKEAQHAESLGDHHAEPVTRQEKPDNHYSDGHTH